MTNNQPASRPPRIIVLSGPSGTGKTTVVARLLESAPVPILKAISATTRQPRAGEVDGQHYHFLTADDFSQRRTAGAFLETAEVFEGGTWYGTLASEIERATAQGAWSLLEIDVRGALAIKAAYPAAVMIFLRAASEADYETRLRGRGTETDAAIRSRLDRMREELRCADRYDYVVVNDDVGRAVDRICDILRLRESGSDA